MKFQTCYLANEIHRRIGQLAKRRNLSRTAIIRMAIDQGLPAVERALLNSQESEVLRSAKRP